MLCEASLLSQSLTVTLRMTRILYRRYAGSNPPLCPSRKTSWEMRNIKALLKRPDKHIKYLAALCKRSHSSAEINPTVLEPHPPQLLSNPSYTQKSEDPCKGLERIAIAKFYFKY